MSDEMRHVRKLADEIGPRPAGTNEEQLAANYIADAFKQRGLRAQVEEFSCASASGLGFALCYALIIVAALFCNVNTVLSIIAFIIAVIACVLLYLERTERGLLSNLGRGGLSQNVVAHYVPERDKRRRRARPVVIIAHYDSRKNDLYGQPTIHAAYPYLRVLTLAGSIAVAAVCLLQALPLPFSDTGSAIIWVIAVICAIPALLGLIAIVVRQVALHYADGANDNASGVAAMIGVAERVLGITPISDPLPAPEPPKEEPAPSDEVAEEEEPQQEEVPERAAAAASYDPSVKRHTHEQILASGVVPESIGLMVTDEAEEAAQAALRREEAAVRAARAMVSEAQKNMRGPGSADATVEQAPVTPAESAAPDDQPQAGQTAAVAPVAASPAPVADAAGQTAVAPAPATPAEPQVESQPAAQEPAPAAPVPVAQQQDPQPDPSAPATKPESVSEAKPQRNPAAGYYATHAVRPAEAMPKQENPEEMQRDLQMRRHAQSVRLAERRRREAALAAQEESASPDESATSMPAWWKRAEENRSRAEARQMPASPQAEKSAPVRSRFADLPIESSFAAAARAAQERAEAARRKAAGIEDEEQAEDPDQHPAQEIPAQAPAPEPASEPASEGSSEARVLQASEPAEPEPAPAVAEAHAPEPAAPAEPEPAPAPEHAPEQAVSDNVIAFAPTASRPQPEPAPAPEDPAPSAAPDPQASAAEEELRRQAAARIEQARKAQAAREQEAVRAEAERRAAISAAAEQKAANVDRQADAELNRILNRSGRPVPARQVQHRTSDRFKVNHPDMPDSAFMPQTDPYDQFLELAPLGSDANGTGVAVPQPVNDPSASSRMRRITHVPQPDSTGAQAVLDFGTGKAARESFGAIDGNSSQFDYNNAPQPVMPQSQQGDAPQATGFGTANVMQGTGTFAAVGDPYATGAVFGGDVIDDADDLRTYNEAPENLPASSYVDIPESRAHRFFDRISDRFSHRGKKKQQEEPINEWLGVDEDYNPRSAGREIGSWDNFDDDDYDDWKGGAASTSGYRDGKSDVLRPARSNGSAVPRDEAERAAGARGRRPYPTVAPSDSEHAGQRESERDGQRQHARQRPAGQQGPHAQHGGGQGQRTHQGAGRNSHREGRPVEQNRQRSRADRPRPERDQQPPRNHRSSRPRRQDVYSPEQVGEMRDQVRDRAEADLFNREVWFVAAGASGAGHAGAREFIANHGAEINGAIVINIEGVGAGELSCIVKEGADRTYTADRRVVGMIHGAAKHLNIPIHPRMLTWRNTDATPFYERKMRTVSIMGLDGDAPASWCWGPDSSDGVDPQLMVEVADLIAQAIRARG